MTVSQLTDFGQARLQQVGGGRLDWRDLIFGLMLGACAAFATSRYSQFMDIYELVIMWACIPGLVFLGWLWPAMRWFAVGCSLLALVGVFSYNGQLAAAEESFLLKYLLSSQSAVLWMCALYGLGCLSYWAGLLFRGATSPSS